MTVINSYDKTAREIRPGNFLFGKKVTLVNPKRTNTYVTLEEPVDGKNQWIFKHDDLLEVGVEELTAEEEAAKKAELLAETKSYLVTKVNNWVKGALEGVDEALKTMAERREKGWTALDHWSIDTYLSAAAQDKIARQLKEELRNATEDHGLSPVEAVIAVLNHEAKNFASRAMRLRVLSRSTSLTSNLCEDLELQAWGQFFDDMSYSAYGIEELDIPRRY